jgi:hypothetical protein
MSAGEFSVYWWDHMDHQYEEHRFVDAETAKSAATRLCRGPASLIVTKRCIITDGGDCVAFEWTKEAGIIFPTNGAQEN